MATNDPAIKPLTALKPGETGIILEISGGEALTDRLNALGIFPRKRIKNVSSMVMRGPVTIEIDRNLVAIGFGMAQKILVQLDG